LDLDLPLGATYRLKQRKQALGGLAAPLAELISERRPRLLLSAGNHFHKPAVAALARVSRDSAPLLIGRVSNALPRFSWRADKLPNSIMKRVNARRRYDAMDALVAVSEEVCRDLETKLLIDGAKITVIPNGIDLAEAGRLGSQPASHPWFEEGRPPVVIAAGRLTAQKGFDVLLRAFARARVRRSLRLLILGEGPEKGRLETLAAELGVAGDVELAGYVDNPLPYFRRAALFVLPSRWEGLSNALLEALASGTPVVASRCSGSTELLDGGRFGALVPVGNVRALSASMLDALGQQHCRENLLARARDYDLSRTLGLYVDLFRRELARSR
jgi:glycosyltransferase involved in cell wall biosynthesis